MNRKIRKIISILFITAFLITSPLLLFYTFGYRYSSKRNIIQPTGALSLVTIPKDAFVSLNGAVQDSTTPFRLTQLQPGSYTVKIEKEGYTTWQRQIMISANMHALFPPIRLFPFSSLVPILPAMPMAKVVWNDSRSTWMIASSSALSNEPTVHYLTPRQNAKVPLKGVFIDAAPSPSDFALAVLVGDGHRVTIAYQSLTNSIQLRSLSLTERYRGIDWLDATTLVFWNDRAIATQPVNGVAHAKLLRQNILHALSDAGILAWLEKNSNGTVDLVSADTPLTEVRAVATLSLSPESILIAGSPEGIFTIWDRTAASVALIAAQENGVSFRFSLPSLNAVEWSEDREELVLVGTHDIALVPWKQFLPTNQILLTRVSESITSYLFASSLEAVFYTTPSHLAFIHLHPQVDQEPHTLMTVSDLVIMGADSSRRQLFIKKGAQLFSYVLHAP